MLSRLLTTALILGAAAPALAGTLTLDQANEAAPGSDLFVDFTFDSNDAFARYYAQTLTVGLTGDLARVEVKLGDPSTPDDVANAVLEVYSLPASGVYLETTLLGSATLPGSALLPSIPGRRTDWVTFDLLSPIAVAAGDKVAFRVTASNAGGLGYIGKNEPPTYADGAAWNRFNGSLFNLTNIVDLTFRTYVEVVPEPSSAALLGLGLTGLVVNRRRRRVGAPRPREPGDTRN